MIIGVDAGCLGIKDKRLKVGVYQLAKNLLLELGKIDKENSYILYSFYPIDREVMKIFGKRVENKVLSSKGWLQLQLPFAINKDKIDVFLGLSQAIPKPLPFSRHIYTIGFLLDLAFEKFPEMYKDSFKKLRENTGYLAEKADKIIAISKSSKKDAINYYYVSPAKISVFYPSIDSPSRCAAGATPPGRWERDKETPFAHKYFLFVGALKPIKNVPTIIRSFEYSCHLEGVHSATFQESRLKEAAFAPHLYIAGGDKWMDKEISKTLNNVSKNVREKIKFLGFVSDDELIKLYQNAEAFVSPSFYEGFGLTFLEAMIFGCPVISSNAGSIPEVIDDAGLLFDPKDEKGMGGAMVKLIQDKKLRDKLVKKGLDQAKKFSSEKFAKEILVAISSPSL